MSALSPSQEALAPLGKVSPERLTEYSWQVQAQKRRRWIQAAVVVALWGIGRVFIPGISWMPLLAVGLVLPSFFRREPTPDELAQAAIGTTDGQDLQLASEDQSERYWRGHRLSERAVWIFAALAIVGFTAGELLPSYGMGIAIGATFLALLTMIVASFSKHCPRCQNSFSGQHIPGRCEKCGVFFRTERKGPPNAA